MPQAEPLWEEDPPAVGPYRLLGRLGSGGQGVVYLGRLPGSAPVAIKVFRDGSGGERFAREVEAARRVEPFCIAQVLDASFGERPYIVTEYVEGPSLQQAGRHHGADLQRLAVATATALAAIHQAGIVHRDFKPANVLLGPGGPRVIDFGIARSAAAGPSGVSGVMGTPAYMAPEQLAGAPVGPATDVFAWGSVMVFAATGSPPFGEDTLPAVINRILHNEPRLGDLAEPLRTIVLHCLAKDPARRPTMQDVLLRLLGGGPHRFGGPAVHTSSAPGAAVPSAARRMWLVAGAASAVTLVVAGGVTWGVRNVWADRQPPAAQALASTTTPAPPTAGAGEPPKRTRTSSPSPRRRRTTSPTARPTTGPPAPTPTRTQPTRTAATRTAKPPAKPATTAPASGGGTLRIARVWASGNTHADTPGCLFGSVNVFGLVEGSKLYTHFSYEWLLDGKVVRRYSDGISSVHTRQVTGPLVEAEGTHQVVLRLTSPQKVSKALTFRICSDEDG
ncbi:serine/threonine protein kinase [Nonomuraea sp. NPDC049309]|uniref:serine/threonine protein kinase n=1 Tax=Nonomuraea sp. NPDC049309 TaxID=3364350 RepID=UPI003715D4E3